MPDESSETSERVAVERVRAGDRDAYAVLVRMHTNSAHRAAVLFGAGPDAEDVVQTAFVKAYESLPRFRNGAPFRPWLLRIVQNEAKTRHGRRRAATEPRAARCCAAGTELRRRKGRCPTRGPIPSTQ